MASHLEAFQQYGNLDEYQKNVYGTKIMSEKDEKIAAAKLKVN